MDDFCREANISHIHFLKLDVEGNEYKLLENSAEMLNGKIDYIQIEFGGANIDARTYFRDFWELLDGDYRFFRILRDGMVEIEKYSERLEQFACTNYLFVRKELA